MLHVATKLMHTETKLLQPSSNQTIATKLQAITKLQLAIEL
jgi:hypothetical protein